VLAILVVPAAQPPALSAEQLRAQNRDVTAI